MASLPSTHRMYRYRAKVSGQDFISSCLNKAPRGATSKAATRDHSLFAISQSVNSLPVPERGLSRFQYLQVFRVTLDECSDRGREKEAEQDVSTSGGESTVRNRNVKERTKFNSKSIINMLTDRNRSARNGVHWSWAILMLCLKTQRNGRGPWYRNL